MSIKDGTIHLSRVQMMPPRHRDSARTVFGQTWSGDCRTFEVRLSTLSFFDQNLGTSFRKPVKMINTALVLPLLAACAHTGLARSTCLSLDFLVCIFSRSDIDINCMAYIIKFSCSGNHGTSTGVAEVNASGARAMVWKLADAGYPDGM